MSDPDDKAARESADTIPVDPLDAPHTNRATPRPGDDDDHLSGLSRHGTFGRFTILDVLGVGGMGIVLAAYDPQLDRKVAIKVLRTRGLTGERHDREAGRLLREARAMAQLSHPHVITVYEAGEIDGRVYVAMEYISGQTLRGWLDERKRSVAEILDVFVKAGRGLAAGHQAMLIHRDFKPDNVLIGFDGRVRVIDFGLARPAHAAVADDDASPDPTAPDTVGQLFGTPLYMAPEQHLRRELDARTDQFAFCVALFEALFGRPPFPTGSYSELSSAVIAGKLEMPEADAEIPARVVDAIRRGLAPSPDDRFPLMDALLDELQPPVRRRRGFAIASIAFAAVAAAASSLLVVRLVSDTPDPCAGGEERLAGVWDSAVAQRTRAAFLASKRTHAADTAERVSATLDAYANRWLDRRRSVCEATKVRNEQSDTAFDLRMQCLAKQLAELGALTALFAHADVATTDNAVAAARSLPNPDDCASLSLDAITPPNAAQRPQVDVLSAELAVARANLSARRYGTAVDKTKSLLDRAKLVDYTPLDAELRYWLGLAYSGASKPAESERTLRDALVDAARAKDDRRIAQLWTLLIYVVGHQQARYVDALALQPVAEVAVRRAGNGPKLQSDLAYQLAGVYLQKGEYKQAIDRFESAIKLVPADDSGTTPYALNAIGGAYLRLGNVFAAKPNFEKSLALMEKTLGPSHPDIALPLANLGGLAQAVGNFEEATKYLERALKILEEVYGPDNTEVGLTLYGLAVSANGREDYKGAIPYYERALAIFEKAGPDHPNVGLALVGLADCREEVGDAERAIPEAERGLKLVDAGSDKIQAALAKYVLAKALWSANRDRPRARALGLEARKGFAAGGMLSLNGLIAVDNWFKKIDAKP